MERGRYWFTIMGLNRRRPAAPRQSGSGELPAERAGFGNPPFQEEMMRHRSKAIAFDVDPDSLTSLRQAIPGWEIEAMNGASTGSLIRDWNPGAADLLVLGAR